MQPNQQPSPTAPTTATVTPPAEQAAPALAIAQVVNTPAQPEHAEHMRQIPLNMVQLGAGQVRDAIMATEQTPAAAPRPAGVIATQTRLGALLGTLRLTPVANPRAILPGNPEVDHLLNYDFSTVARTQAAAGELSLMHSFNAEANPITRAHILSALISITTPESEDYADLSLLLNIPLATLRAWVNGFTSFVIYRVRDLNTRLAATQVQSLSPQEITRRTTELADIAVNAFLQSPLLTRAAQMPAPAQAPRPAGAIATQTRLGALLGTLRLTPVANQRTIVPGSPEVNHLLNYDFSTMARTQAAAGELSLMRFFNAEANPITRAQLLSALISIATPESESYTDLSQLLNIPLATLRAWVNGFTSFVIYRVRDLNTRLAATQVQNLSPQEITRRTEELTEIAVNEFLQSSLVTCTVQIPATAPRALAPFLPAPPQAGAIHHQLQRPARHAPYPAAQQEQARARGGPPDRQCIVRRVIDGEPRMIDRRNEQSIVNHLATVIGMQHAPIFVNSGDNHNYPLTRAMSFSERFIAAQESPQLRFLLRAVNYCHGSDFARFKLMMLAFLALREQLYSGVTVDLPRVFGVSRSTLFGWAGRARFRPSQEREISWVACIEALYRTDGSVDLQQEYQSFLNAHIRAEGERGTAQVADQRPALAPQPAAQDIAAALRPRLRFAANEPEDDSNST
ncbi:MAG: hypothetical protein ACRCWB_01615 [Enterovibrio sp.]